MTNIPAPYRVEFFNELSKLCDLTVIYERKMASDREPSWFSNEKGNYRNIFLNGKCVGTDSSVSIGAIKHLSKNNYDIIIFGVYHTLTAMITMQYLRWRRIKFILNSDGGFIKKDSAVKYKLKRHFIHMADAYLSSGNNTSDYLEHYGANKKKIYIYPFTSLHDKDILEYVVDSEHKKRIKEKLNIREEKVVFSVGQIIYRKGFDILIMACKKLPENVGVYIAGGQPSEDILRLMKQNDINNLHFIGFKNREELAEYYQLADLFVLPTREDIWGLVVNEALSYGLPVITTNKCNAGLELINNGVNGYIVNVNDVEELSNKMIKLLLSDTILRSMAGNCLVKIREYSLEKMALNHKTMFDSFLKQ